MMSRRPLGDPSRPDFHEGNALAWQARILAFRNTSALLVSRDFAAHLNEIDAMNVPNANPVERLERQRRALMGMSVTPGPEEVIRQFSLRRMDDIKLGFGIIRDLRAICREANAHGLADVEATARRLKELIQQAGALVFQPITLQDNVIVRRALWYGCQDVLGQLVNATGGAK